MWLTAGSWLYAKWDFPFEIYRSWSAIRLTQVTGPPPLDGDYNEDGFVDVADYAMWRKTNIGGAEGYAAWVTNFGQSAGGTGAGGVVAISVVPEPTGWIFVVLAVFHGALQRHRCGCEARCAMTETFPVRRPERAETCAVASFLQC
jgi:hypothetical protein